MNSKIDYLFRNLELDDYEITLSLFRKTIIYRNSLFQKHQINHQIHQRVKEILEKHWMEAKLIQQYYLSVALNIFSVMHFTDGVRLSHTNNAHHKSIPISLGFY